MVGRLIRLFLVDGKPNGLRTVEISNMTLHGTMFPRPRLEGFLSRDTARKPAVYLLIGPDLSNPEETRLYVGEGDPVEPRIRDHARNKDFWTDAVVFTSKDGYLTKTQIKYLAFTLRPKKRTGRCLTTPRRRPGPTYPKSKRPRYSSFLRA